MAPSAANRAITIAIDDLLIISDLLVPENTRVPPARYLILAWCKDVRDRDESKTSEQLRDWIPVGR
jgi:hypothetical protein